MTWFVFSFLTAFFESSKDVFSKQSLKQFDNYIIAWLFSFLTFVLLLPSLLIVGIPELGDRFWTALLASGSVNVIATLLYMRALKQADLSLAVPLITFTPLFLLLTSPIIAGEHPTFLDFIGVVLIVGGAYMLNVRDAKRGYLAPLRSLLRESGPKLMLFVAFLWSVTSSFDKVGLNNSSPLFWVTCVYGFVAIAMFPIVARKSWHNFRRIPDSWQTLGLIGVCNALAVGCQMTALSMTLVVHVISIKRMSALIGVLFGYFVFKEQGIQERLAGAVMMILGVLAITL